jgi:hypothetical protein
MHDHLMGPYWGNVIIIGIASAITVACFLGMIVMIVFPGELERTHPKY